jgi:hypothetical protein
MVVMTIAIVAKIRTFMVTSPLLLFRYSGTPSQVAQVVYLTGLGR